MTNTKNNEMEKYMKEDFLYTKILEILFSERPNNCIIEKNGFENILHTDKFSRFISNVKKKGKGNITCNIFNNTVEFLIKDNNHKVIINKDSYDKACYKVDAMLNKMIEKFRNVVKDAYDEKHCFEPIIFIINKSDWNLPFGYYRNSLKTSLRVIGNLLRNRMEDVEIRLDDHFYIFNDIDTISDTQLVFIPQNYTIEDYKNIVTPSIVKYLCNI